MHPLLRRVAIDCPGSGPVFDVLGRYLRVAGTGLSFTLFGLGGLLFAITAFPVIAHFSSTRELGYKRVRRVVHYLFRWFLWFVRSLGVIDVSVEGTEKLENCRGCLIVANHPTLLDVVILMALMPNVQCMVKHQLWQNVFLRGVVSSAGFIRNDLSADDILEQCSRAFADGENLLVFPEGTRTVAGSYPRLLRGFANIAILSHADIQIVVIQCEPVMLTGGEPWYAVPRSRPCFQVRIDQRWSGNSLEPTPHRALNARQLVRSLESYYQDTLSNG